MLLCRPPKHLGRTDGIEPCWWIPVVSTLVIQLLPTFVNAWILFPWVAKYVQHLSLELLCYN